MGRPLDAGRLAGGQHDDAEAEQAEYDAPPLALRRSPRSVVRREPPTSEEELVSCSRRFRLFQDAEEDEVTLDHRQETRYY